MKKIAEFIYPWGNGHYQRMMTLNNELLKYMGHNDVQFHFISMDHVYEKLIERFPQKKEFIHKILMPVPIDGKKGPSTLFSLLNLLIPISNKPPLLKQIFQYLVNEAKLYDEKKFDLVINDGDIGSNVLARKRKIKSVFITNQFMPKLWKSHFYFLPSLLFISKQISKAEEIFVADSPPPYTICEYNLNFTDEIKKKVTYVGHFANKTNINKLSKIYELLHGNDFGYWMRTGNKSTNDFTGKRYNEIFNDHEMRNEKRVISYARNNKNINRVVDMNDNEYSIIDAIEKKIEWKQIDIGYLTENEKQIVLNLCKYAVANGSHTTIGEIVGANNKPVIGIPVYDEHTNQLKWIQDRGLGILANNKKQVIKAVLNIKNDYNKYLERIYDFSKNFVSDGAKNAARIINNML